MLKLSVFNPEHDEAMVYNRRHFSPSKAAVNLRRDVGPDICSLEWIEPRWGDDCFRFHACQPSWPLVWGWDMAVKQELLDKGVPESALPTDAQIDNIRTLSHRRTAIEVLRNVRAEDASCSHEFSRSERGHGLCPLVGEAWEVRDYGVLASLLDIHRNIVVKAPWSGSGRGLCFLYDNVITPQQCGWIKNVLKRQGSVVVEPLYNKSADFAIEYICDDYGVAVYLGLSLFETVHGAYSGNVIATEPVKRGMLVDRMRAYDKNADATVIDRVAHMVADSLTKTLNGRYIGPLGVDMMLVRSDDGKLAIHPCVEVNLRCTMGHVALALAPEHDDVTGTMTIGYESNRFKLNIEYK